MDPKEKLLQELATSLLRDVFATATAAAIIASDRHYNQVAAADEAFAFADRMLVRSHTPNLIKELSKLKP